MAEEQLNPIPRPSHEPHPLAAPTVKTPTVTSCKSTQRIKCKTKRKSNTTQKIIDKVELEQLNPMPAVVIEPAVDNAIPGPSHEPQPLATTTVVEELPPTPKAKKRKTHASVFTLPRKRTRLARSTATTVTTPIVTASTPTSSLVEPDAPQNPHVAATECLDFADAQTLLDFYIHNTNLREPQIDLMGVHIPGFTLCKELQETILSIQA
jgi:hypothetical protein